MQDFSLLARSMGMYAIGLVTRLADLAPDFRSALHALAVQLYGLISSGHDALAYNVDARGPALTTIGADGKRRPVQTAGGGGGASAPP
jgi:hypothetical protein